VSAHEYGYALHMTWHPLRIVQHGSAKKNIVRRRKRGSIKKEKEEEAVIYDSISIENVNSS